ncbi:hypothetical protein RhiirC2_704650 [Rhizophagus irregularis]|uniref:Uncharacterized protein n=1 Tax=Rhizophagus irregularis TaxID=588596 RepID=A0A2N1P1B1_9GLOM|nr:hypothetical protein RhiirC2_704650 [Rhizophagus irregularis]
MTFYRCPYILRSGEVCNQICYQKKECLIHWNSPPCNPCKKCGKLTYLKYGTCNIHAKKTTRTTRIRTGPPDSTLTQKSEIFFVIYYKKLEEGYTFLDKNPNKADNQLESNQSGSTNRSPNKSHSQWKSKRSRHLTIKPRPKSGQLRLGSKQVYKQAHSRAHAKEPDKAKTSRRAKGAGKMKATSKAPRSLQRNQKAVVIRSNGDNTAHHRSSI